MIVFGNCSSVGQKPLISTTEGNTAVVSSLKSVFSSLATALPGESQGQAMPDIEGSICDCSDLNRWSECCEGVSHTESGRAGFDCCCVSFVV